MSRLFASIAPITVALAMTACATVSSAPKAIAQLEPTKGSNVSGTVTFTQVGDAVRVHGEIRGLQPGTEHGFHIHEKGDCSSGDGMSAGGHFNPTAQPHGAYDGMAHHAGDLPSLRADANGNATVDYLSKSFAVGNGSTDVVGRGLIVHRDADDFKTQPTGNSGARLACAVIAKN